MTPECLAVQQAIFDAGEAVDPLARPGALAAHVSACTACRAWRDAFRAGAHAAALDTGLTAAVLLSLDARGLLADPACIEAGVLDLDPGAAFTARVIAATSRMRPPRAKPAAWRRGWDALVGRPRFAIEAAYVLTVLLVLLAGGPLTAVSRTAARVEPLIGRLAGPAEAIDLRVREAHRHVKAATLAAAAAAEPYVGPPRATWARDAVRRLAAPIASWLSRIGAAATTAADWIGRHLGDPHDGPVHSTER